MNDELRPYKNVDRRAGTDSWIKAITWLGVAGWFLMFIALLIIEKAKPQMETFFDRFF